jgi:hypothetical protein
MDVNVFFNGKIISKASVLSGFSKYWGLMFSKKLRRGKSVIFIFDKERKVGIHMLFVFFPLDIVFLNSKKRVVDVRRSLPFISFIIPRKKAKYVIEMNRGENVLRVGDKVEFV